MSMLLDYAREVRGLDAIETPKGFVTFRISRPFCYIEDIYVRPEHRASGAASALASQVRDIAKEQGCSTLTGSVDCKNKGCSQRVQLMLGYGFEIATVTQDAIYFKMEI